MDWIRGAGNAIRNRNERKAKNKAANVALLPAGTVPGSIPFDGMSPPPYQRRDLSVEDDLVARDDDGELELRDLEPRLFTEWIREHDKAKAKRLREKADRATAKVSGTSMGPMTMDTTGGLLVRMFEDQEYDQRDLMDGEGDLAARYYDEEGDLTARDYDEELEMRDFDEDKLVARETSTIFDALSAVARTFTPPTKDAAPPHEARDVLEELDARDFDEIDELD